MKKAGKILITILSVATLLIAGQVIVEGPTARNEGDDIVLQWKTGDESGVREFQIWRSGGEGAALMQIATIAPKGSNSRYEYKDRSVFKSTASIYYYRVVVVFLDGSQSQSALISVSHLSSTARRTWGSIKAMFR